MKVEGLVFAVIGAFLLTADIVYWYTSKDPTGTVCIALSFGLAALIGGYLLFTARRMEPRPQDLPDAEVADGAGELGHFSPGSYFPVGIAFGATVTLVGVAIGLWMSLIGLVLLVGCVMGLLFEQYVNSYSVEDP